MLTSRLLGGRGSNRTDGTVLGRLQCVVLLETGRLPQDDGGALRAVDMKDSGQPLLTHAAGDACCRINGKIHESHQNENFLLRRSTAGCLSK